MGDHWLELSILQGFQRKKYQCQVVVGVFTVEIPPEAQKLKANSNNCLLSLDQINVNVLPHQDY